MLTKLPPKSVWVSLSCFQLQGLEHRMITETFHVSPLLFVFWP
jgi:hypothetical protein